MTRRLSIDVFFAFFLLPLILPILALLYLVVVPLQGRPFLFVSRRMRSPEEAFSLYKIRTMRPTGNKADPSALGGDQKWRVTPIGAFLRRSRMDELPQIFNVLRGDIRFIGPRPPLVRHVRDFPEAFEHVLRDTPPGITGLATVMLHAREERLLSACNSAEETEAVYRKRCLPLKTRIDLIYRDRRNWRLNAMILWMTFARLRPGPSRDLSLSEAEIPARPPSDPLLGAAPLARVIRLKDAA